MFIGNLLSSYKSETNFEDVSIKLSGWRSQDIKEKAAELRLKNRSLDDIAELFSVTTDTVARWCRDILGREKAFEISKISDSESRSKSKEKRKAILIKLLESNHDLTTAQLAKKLKVSIVTIRNNIKEINQENNHGKI